MEVKTANPEKVPREFQRFDIHQRIQHIIMFSTFIMLSITGLAIKFWKVALAPKVMVFFGGFDNLFMVHVISGWTMVAGCIYHLIWMAVRAYQRKLGWAILPGPKDIKDVVDTLNFYTGRSDQPPRYDRYSYKEKFDYWAVFWGMFVIGGSGVFMTFPEWGMALFPRWILDIWQVGHSDEAVLAIVFIFAIHFYNVHFCPDFFPGSMVWWTGRMSKKVMEHEHPAELDRILKDYEKNGYPPEPYAPGQSKGTPRYKDTEVVYIEE